MTSEERRREGVSQFLTKGREVAWTWDWQGGRGPQSQKFIRRHLCTSPLWITFWLTEYDSQILESSSFGRACENILRRRLEWGRSRFWTEESESLTTTKQRGAACSMQLASLDTWLMWCVTRRAALKTKCCHVSPSLLQYLYTLNRGNREWACS